ncbi:XRE family transcriptional regulator [Oceanisphaera psychrotolerans]|uniref:XRE family transcriptional regulator n=1 Tax=Oceanisphaera psychrotolerans TaxID=1414654 RepID=UPI00158736B5|nr:S24 family peptidase [Oceanisphaera psychrotolerans]
MSNFEGSKEAAAGMDSFDLKGFTERMELILGDESARSFGARCGLSDTAIKKYRSGASTPNVERLIAIANAAGVDVKWLATGQGNRSADDSDAESQSKVLWVDSYDVFVSAGNGAHNEWDHLEARVPFSTAWLEDHGLIGKRLAVLKVHGDSMSPTLEHGDTPLVEMLPEDAVENLPDSVYVLRLNGQLLIKRLQSDLMGGLYIKSDNPAYDKLHLTQDNKPDDIRIIARWTGKKI